MKATHPPYITPTLCVRLKVLERALPIAEKNLVMAFPFFVTRCREKEEVKNSSMSGSSEIIKINTFSAQPHSFAKSLNTALSSFSNVSGVIVNFTSSTSAHILRKRRRMMTSGCDTQLLLSGSSTLWQIVL
eukprot:superscaffoldBa00010632_g24811